MKINLIPLAVLVLFFQVAPAQEKPVNLTTVSWNPKPTVHKTDDKYKTESAVIISDTRRLEYADIDEKNLVQYRTLHKIIHINDDRGIETFNRIYLDVSDNADIKDIRARTILPDGRVIEIDKSNIKDIQEKERWYKIFAMEAVEKGCDIEFYYTYKCPFSYFGREILQGSFPVINSSIEIVAPDRLVFDLKAFNSEINARDTVLDGKRFVSIHQTQIAAAEDEKYSAYDAMLNRAEYKLSYNKNRNEEVRLFTWNELAKLAYSSYSTFSDGEQRRAIELIKKQNWEKLASDTEKIVQVEKFIKSNITTRSDVGGENAENLEKIIKTRIASNRGTVRLYSAVLSKLNIKHEYVLAGSRESFELEKSFENWDNAENAMIYFPSLQKFICPTLVEMRYPWINPLWSGTNGLFCKPTTIGNFSTALGLIKTIPIENYDATQNNIYASIKFNNSVDTLIISSENTFSGYSSVYMRSGYNFSSQEDQKLMIKEMVRSGTSSENIISSGFRNTEFDHLRYNNPFILDAKVNSVELIERSGKKILIKIGEIIGDQVQIYESKPRQWPIHLNYPHLMKRNIVLEIPQGYRLLNPEVLNIRSVFEDGGERTMGFESSYTLNDRVLQVNITEDYRKIWYPVSQYAPFQEIINAAADFNKAVLVIEKN